MFSCPECLEVMPREKLTRLKVLHRNIAGANISAPFDVRILGSTSFYDASALTSVMTVTNCVLKSGDLALVCVGAGGVAAASLSSNVTIGGAAMILVQDPTGAGGGSDPDTDVYYKRNNTPGSKTVSITLDQPCSAGAALVLGVSGTKGPTIAIDQSTGIGGTGPTFDSGATGNLNPNGDFLLGVVAVAAASTSGASSFPSRWTFIQRVGTSQSAGSPPDVFLDVAWSIASGTSPVSFTGTVASSQALSCGIAAFLRA
jgi:hypothetical protein